MLHSYTFTHRHRCPIHPKVCLSDEWWITDVGTVLSVDSLTTDMWSSLWGLLLQYTMQVLCPENIRQRSSDKMTLWPSRQGIRNLHSLKRFTVFPALQRIQIVSCQKRTRRHASFQNPCLGGILYLLLECKTIRLGRIGLFSPSLGFQNKGPLTLTETV